MRKAVVAGQFYPGDSDVLKAEVDAFLKKDGDRIDAVGAVAPHAGYMFSGHVAGEVYANIEPKDTYIILSPNHTGYGHRFSAVSEDWVTPLGIVRTDTVLLKAVMERTELIRNDMNAHMFEHSVEVQLPFIQRTSPAAAILPVTIKHGDIGEYHEIAGAISEAADAQNKNCIMIASSDMNHYEPRHVSRDKDRMAIDAMEKLDPEGFLAVVEEKGISMCGYIPAAIMIMYAKIRGAERCRLIKYSDSGEITSDDSSVVGYAGIVVY